MTSLQFVSEISVYHVSINGSSLGSHTLVVLKGCETVKAFVRDFVLLIVADCVLTLSRYL